MEGDERVRPTLVDPLDHRDTLQRDLFLSSERIEPPVLLRALDRAGSDAVIRGYAPKMDEQGSAHCRRRSWRGPTTKNRRDTLELMAAKAHPKAVGLDLIFVKDLQDNRSKSGANPIDSLAR